MKYNHHDANFIYFVNNKSVVDFARSSITTKNYCCVIGTTGCPVTDRGTLALQKNGQF